MFEQRERMPISWQAEVRRLVPLVAVLISVSWRWGMVWAAGVTAVVLVLGMLCTPGALVLDETGLRFVPLMPRLPFLGRRSPISWSSIGRFVVWTPSTAGRGPRVSFVRLLRPSGERAWWSIAPVYALRPHGPALSAQELCDLLNDRLARAS